MSELIDQFAAIALTEMLSDPELNDLEDTILASRAYEIASAMLEERQKWRLCSDGRFRRDEDEVEGDK